MTYGEKEWLEDMTNKDYPVRDLIPPEVRAQVLEEEARRLRKIANDPRVHPTPYPYGWITTSGWMDQRAREIREGK